MQLSSSSSLNVASSDSNSDSASDEDDTFREYVQQRKEALLNSLSAAAAHRHTLARSITHSLTTITLPHGLTDKGTNRLFDLQSVAAVLPSADCGCCCCCCGPRFVLLVFCLSPVFGVYRRVESRAGFAELVSSVHSHVWVVAHLYSNSVELCARLHFALDALAASFEHVLFVRVRAEDVMAGFAEAGLPAFMLYKDGKCVANALRLGDVLPPHFSDADVARLLQSKNVLQLPDGTEWMEEKKRQRKKAAPKFTLSRAANSDDNSDGD